VEEGYLAAVIDGKDQVDGSIGRNTRAAIARRIAAKKAKQAAAVKPAVTEEPAPLLAQQEPANGWENTNIFNFRW
jgi:hypothetical protein